MSLIKFYLASNNTKLRIKGDFKNQFLFFWPAHILYLCVKLINEL